MHFVLVLVLIQLTMMPAEWFDILLGPTPPPIERVGFLQLPQGEPPSEPPRRGGNDVPQSPLPSISVPRAIAPFEAPSGLPLIPSRPPRTAEDIGTGPLVGGGGETRGVRPAYTDQRLWVRNAPTVAAPLVGTEKLDSAIAPIFRELADSMRAAAASGRDPNDWTFRMGGQKFGIDQRFIRLGPVSIPTAALAFLPLNVQANPGEIDRNRRLSQMRTEIMAQSMRAARDDDFRKAVQALRERKEKEREDKKKADRPPPRAFTP